MLNEFKKIFKNLCANYQKPLDKDLCEFWFEELEVFDIEEINRAFKKIMSSDKFFPNLNRIFQVLNSSSETKIDEFKKEEKFMKSGIYPSWYQKEIENQKIDLETEKSFKDFQEFIKNFRNEKEIIC